MSNFVSKSITMASECRCCGVCCPNRCNTVNGESCDNPLPLTLTCTLTVSTPKNDPITGIPSGCFTVTGILYLSPLNGWIGVVYGSCSGWCGTETRIFEYEVRVTCGLSPDGSIRWYLTIQENLGGDPASVCNNSSIPIAYAILDSTCVPILLTGQTTPFECLDLTCVIPNENIDATFGTVVFDVLVTENP